MCDVEPQRKDSEQLLRQHGDLFSPKHSDKSAVDRRSGGWTPSWCAAAALCGSGFCSGLRVENLCHSPPLRPRKSAMKFGFGQSDR